MLTLHVVLVSPKYPNCLLGFSVTAHAACPLGLSTAATAVAHYFSA